MHHSFAVAYANCMTSTGINFKKTAASANRFASSTAIREPVTPPSLRRQPNLGTDEASRPVHSRQACQLGLVEALPGKWRRVYIARRILDIIEAPTASELVN